jgi:hypothetical protein
VWVARAGGQIDTLEPVIREDLEQMEALNYPPQVHQVMEKYHRQWAVNRSLHLGYGS